MARNEWQRLPKLSLVVVLPRSNHQPSYIQLIVLVMAASARTASVYRQLLRAASRLQRDTTIVGSRDLATATRSTIQYTFRQHRNEQDPAVVQELLAFAEQEIVAANRLINDSNATEVCRLTD
jgi:hypothetical protein